MSSSRIRTVPGCIPGSTQVQGFSVRAQILAQVLGGDVAVRKPDRLNAVVGVPPVFDGQHIRKPGKGLALLFNADLEVITRKPHHNLLTTQIPHDERVVARMVPLVHSGKARLGAVPLRVVVKETHPAAGPAIAVAVVARSSLNNRTRSPGRDMNAVVAARGKHFVRPAAGDNRIPIVAGGDGIVARAQTEICRTLRPGEVLPFA